MGTVWNIESHSIILGVSPGGKGTGVHHGWVQSEKQIVNDVTKALNGTQDHQELIECIITLQDHTYLFQGFPKRGSKV